MPFNEIINEKNLVGRYFILLLCLFLSAILFNIFLLPTNLVIGGVNGVAVLLHHLFDFDPSLVILLISISMLIFSFFFLGLEKTMGSLVATIVYPFS